MTSIDLRKDADDLQSMLKTAVQSYIALNKKKAGSHPPVTRIDLAFSLGDTESTPWVHLHLDTKPGSEPDGDPTHPDFGKLLRKGWLPAVVAVCDGNKVSVQPLKGKSKACDEEALLNEIGEFLVAVLLNAKAEGVFANLPRAEHCELGVEDPTTGGFGWPVYEERGQRNLV